MQERKKYEQVLQVSRRHISHYADWRMWNERMARISRPVGMEHSVADSVPAECEMAIIGKVTRKEMDEIIDRAVYHPSDNSWELPLAYYTNEVYTLTDAVYDECKSVYYEEDFDDFMDYCIDNFNDYDVDNVDFLEEYYHWKVEEKKKKARERAKKEIINRF